MTARKINLRKGALAYRVSSGLTGAVLAITVLGSGPAWATDAEFTRVGPERSGTALFDPFRTFTNCLSAAAHSDSMYPGLDPDEVNSCLEDHGVL